MSSDNNYCTFYIVRHGQTQWNVKGIIQGQSNSSDLTDKGKEQAKQLDEYLRHVHFDAIFSSDLSRARNTAEIIALGRKLAVETTKALRERKFGRFEGKLRAELLQFEQSFHKMENNQKFRYKPYPDVESDEEVASRFITFLREVAVAYPKKNVLIVTHGAMMRTLLFHLGGLAYKKSYDSIGNAALIKLDSDGVDFFVKETRGINK